MSASTGSGSRINLTPTLSCARQGFPPTQRERGRSDKSDRPAFSSDFDPLLHHAGCTPPTVVFGGSGGGDGIPGAITGCKRRYTASEIAPMPQNAAPYFTQKPTWGIIAHRRRTTKPTAIRPIRGQSSLVRPIIH